MAEELIRRNGYKWMREYNAVGVGYGFKVIGGKVTEELAIIFYVRRKLPETQLRRLGIKIVPRTIEGFKTDVVEVPEGFKVRQDDKKYRPILGGIAGINYKEKATGTLGLINSQGELLSNNHVLACGATNMNSPCEKGDCILQPGYHGKAVFPDDCVGWLSRWVPVAIEATSDCRVANAFISVANKVLEILGRRGRLRYVVEKADNLVDAAVAHVTAEYKPLEIIDVGRVSGIKKLELGDRVLKRGRTTLLTRGYVVATNVEVDVGGYAGDSEAHFVDQIAIYSLEEGKPFSQPGDSGSIIVAEDRSVGGLLFAGGTDAYGNDITLANKIQYVVKLLNYRVE